MINKKVASQDNSLSTSKINGSLNKNNILSDISSSEEFRVSLSSDNSHMDSKFLKVTKKSPKKSAKKTVKKIKEIKLNNLKTSKRKKGMKMPNIMKYKNSRVRSQLKQFQSPLTSPQYATRNRIRVNFSKRNKPKVNEKTSENVLSATQLPLINKNRRMVLFHNDAHVKSKDEFVNLNLTEFDTQEEKNSNEALDRFYAIKPIDRSLQKQKSFELKNNKGKVLKNIRKSIDQGSKVKKNFNVPGRTKRRFKKSRMNDKRFDNLLINPKSQDSTQPVKPLSISQNVSRSDREGKGLSKPKISYMSTSILQNVTSKDQEGRSGVQKEGNGTRNQNLISKAQPLVKPNAFEVLGRTQTFDDKDLSDIQGFDDIGEKSLEELIDNDLEKNPLEKMDIVIKKIQSDLDNIQRGETERISQIDYIEVCLRKIISVRSEFFMEHVKSLIKIKDDTIKSLSKKLSNSNELKSENAQLKNQNEELRQNQVDLTHKIDVLQEKNFHMRQKLISKSISPLKDMSQDRSPRKMSKHYTNSLQKEISYLNKPADKRMSMFSQDFSRMHKDIQKGKF
ncbi:unnamed protein product [Moneuplotes crassus]|uniref:Uncharacterized protein n=1 Tax=Euplotes crassus TaxID=5936 RepID=A0AAD1Y9T9_EUPCR|nr:unnamed protein product [Moneuplotes crassus]